MLLPTTAPLRLLRKQAFTVTYDDGFYHPTQATSAIEQAASIYSSLDINSVITESIGDSITVSLSSITPTQSTSATSNSASASSPTNTALEVSSAASSTPSPTTTSKNTVTNQEDKKGLHITAKQLIPLFIILGIVAMLIFVGKIWGTYANKKSSIARRRRKQNRQLLRDHMRAEREKALENKIRNREEDGQTCEEEDRTQLEKRYDEFDAANSSYDDEIQQHGKRNVYEDEIQTTPWLEMQWRSVFRGKTHKRLLMEEKEFQKRGTWGRIKYNIGWGYDGTSSVMPQRSELLGIEVGESDAAHILLYNATSPQSPPGILLPPTIDKNDKLNVSKGRRKPIPRTPPEIKAPPNTMREVQECESETRVAVKELFSLSHKKESLTLGKKDEDTLLLSGNLAFANGSNASFGHYHADGSRCSLDEPQYLPPPNVRHKAEIDKTNVANALMRVPTQLQVRDQPEYADKVDQRLSMPSEKVTLLRSHDSIIKAEQVDDLLDKEIAQVIDCIYQPAQYHIQSDVEDKEIPSEVVEADEGECIVFKSPTTDNENLKADVDDLFIAKTQCQRRTPRSQSAKLNRKRTARSYTQAVKFDSDTTSSASSTFERSRSAEQRGLSRSKTMTKFKDFDQIGEMSGKPKLSRATTLGSPMVSPKSLWIERNGKWERATDDDSKGNDVESPMMKDLTRPPAAWQKNAVPPMPLSPPRMTKVSSTVRGGPGSSPTRPLPLRSTNSIMSPSVYSTISSDTHYEPELQLEIRTPLYSFRQEYDDLQDEDEEEEEIIDEMSHLRPYQDLSSATPL